MSKKNEYKKPTKYLIFKSKRKKENKQNRFMKDILLNNA